MQRTHALLVFAAALVFGITCGRSPVPDKPITPRKTLKVLDINVWSGLDYKGNVWMGEYDGAPGRAKRRQVLIEGIRQLDPDVIGIHEANKLPSYAEDLAADLGMVQMNHPGVGGVRAGIVGLPWNLREGDAILAKPDLGFHPIERRQLSGGYVGSFFTLHFDDATQALAARIIVNGKPVTLYATHWHASALDTAAVAAHLAAEADRRKTPDDELKQTREAIRAGAQWRLDEAAATTAFVRATAEGPAILFGDFNSTTDTAEMRALTVFGFLDSFTAANSGQEKPTWDPGKNLNQIRYYPRAQNTATLMEEIEDWFDHEPKRIDHILYKPGTGVVLKPRASRVVLDEAVDGIHASDHFGIFTEFEVAPE